MNSKRLEPGDERNAPFAPQGLNAAKDANAAAGFDAGEEAVGQDDAAECHNRFPNRKSKAEIPQESLAERLRKQQQGG